MFEVNVKNLTEERRRGGGEEEEEGTSSVWGTDDMRHVLI